MAFTFTIAAVAKSLQPGWRISEVVNGRNVMEFAVQSLDGTYRPAARAVVALSYNSTVTITNASPGVVTWAAHGLVNNDTVMLSTTGALPTGLSVATIYYLGNVSLNTFTLSGSFGGPALNTSSAGSGTHTATLTLFTGKIHNQHEAGLGGYGVTPIETGCGATDYNVYADEREFELTIPAGSTLKQGLTLIVAQLAAKGVTLDAAQANGPTFEADFVLDFGKASAHLEKLSTATEHIWDISYTKVLRMWEPGDVAAPFNIAAGDGYVIGDIQVEPSLDGFANVITVRYSSTATTAYQFFVKSSGTFANGETVTVGGKTYTLQTTLTDVDGNVFCDVASNLITLENIERAITLGAGAGTSYAASMTLNGLVTAGMQAEDAVKVVAKQAGASGNTIACTETCAGATWGAATLLFGADESLLLWVTAPQDPAELPAAIDRVDRRYDHPEVRDEATAQLLANGYLVQGLASPDTITYRTHRNGLHPGQSQTIVESRRNLNATCLITGVDITATGNVLHYDITAVKGLTLPTPEVWYERGGIGQSSASSITTLTIGANGVINSGATLWGTGTGFWLDYNAGTPRFRIGTVAGNRFVWDGTNLEIVSANLTIDDNGVFIEPNPTASAEFAAYRFGDQFGLYGYLPTFDQQELALISAVSGVDIASIFVQATNTTSGDEALLSLYADSGLSEISLVADQTKIGSAAYPGNFTFDGNNLIVGTSVGATFQATSGTADTVGYDIQLRKARGTRASPTVITTGDTLGAIKGYGYGGAAGYIQAASIRFVSSGTIADSRVPGEIQFWTGTNAAPSVLTQRMTIDNAGTVTHLFAVTDAGATLCTGVISPTQLVANTNDWGPTGLATCNVIRINVDAARDITGLVAQASGTMLLLYNTTGFTVTLKHDVTSTAANRFYGPGPADYLLTSLKSVWIRYDGTHTRWTIIGA